MLIILIKASRRRIILKKYFQIFFLDVQILKWGNLTRHITAGLRLIEKISCRDFFKANPLFEPNPFLSPTPFF